MMNRTDIGTVYLEPVLRRIEVQASPARAFDVFAAGIGRWWLATHSIIASKSPQVAVVIEPSAGGRWYERGADGSESDWGRVRVWEPPRRLVLAWMLDANWAFDPAHVTEVEVRFEPRQGGGTAVSLEHRGLERYGADAAAVRQSLGSAGGWQGLLERYAAQIRPFASRGGAVTNEHIDRLRDEGES